MQPMGTLYMGNEALLHVDWKGMDGTSRVWTGSAFRTTSCPLLCVTTSCTPSSCSCALTFVRDILNHKRFFQIFSFNCGGCSARS